MTNLTDLVFYWLMSVLIGLPIVYAVWNAIQEEELNWFMACVLFPPVAFVRGVGLYYNIW